jgi:hypothetical protein
LADRADDRDDGDGGHGEVHDGTRVATEHPRHEATEYRRELLRLQDVVDDDLDGPGLENDRDRLAQHGHERETQRLPVRPDEVDDLQLPRRRRRRWMINVTGHCFTRLYQGTGGTGARCAPL